MRRTVSRVEMRELIHVPWSIIRTLPGDLALETTSFLREEERYRCRVSAGCEDSKGRIH